MWPQFAYFVRVMLSIKYADMVHISGYYLTDYIIHNFFKCTLQLDGYEKSR